MKAKSTIQKNLKELRTLIEMSPDPIERRIAYAMECAVRWATEKTVGWSRLSEEARKEAFILKKEVREKSLFFEQMLSQEPLSKPWQKV